MTTNRKTTWTLVDGVYRTVRNDRHIWVARVAAGEWQYGTAGGNPIGRLGITNESIIRGNWDIQCIYGAPRKHIAMADAIMLANSLRPEDRPIRRLYLGRMTRIWDVNPAAEYARLVHARLDAERAQAEVREDDAIHADTVAYYAALPTVRLLAVREKFESVLDMNEEEIRLGVQPTINPQRVRRYRVNMARINAELARRGKVINLYQVDDGMSWYMFRAYNTASQCGYGTEDEAARYCDWLNLGKVINLYQVDGPIAEYSHLIKAVIRNESGLNLADELQAIKEEA